MKSSVPVSIVAHCRGALNSTIAGLRNPFNVIEEFKGEYRSIAADLRKANPGQSTGPLEIDRPWDSHTDDQVGLLPNARPGSARWYRRAFVRCRSRVGDAWRRRAQMSMHPWKQPPERIPLAIRPNTFLPTISSACLDTAVSRSGVLPSLW
jgi:hypothetical protein